MQEDHKVILYSKQGSRYAMTDVRSHFPYTRLNLFDQWHSQRPTKLRRFDILAYQFTIFRRQIEKPIPYRLVARLGTVKTHFQDGRIACYNMSVSELVLSCQYPEEEQAGDLKKYY